MIKLYGISILSQNNTSLSFYISPISTLWIFNWISRDTLGTHGVRNPGSGFSRTEPNSGSGFSGTEPNSGSGFPGTEPNSGSGFPGTEPETDASTYKHQSIIGLGDLSIPLYNRTCAATGITKQ